MVNCNCGGNSSSNINENDVIILQEEPTQCPATFHEIVCVQADVTITPHVVVGDIRSFCVNGPKIGGCEGIVRTECTFKVSQNICVQIPLTFSATGSAVESGIVCGEPKTGPCGNVSGCTFTRGFFRNHPSVTNQLIEEEAGGSIILGAEIGGVLQGLSVEATTENATSVILAGNQPGPLPIYSNLYAQLLTAKLNVLNGATCQFADTTIQNADAFLAAGTVDQDAASDLVDDLSEFNEGRAEGCPEHCPGDNDDNDI